MAQTSSTVDPNWNVDQARQGFVIAGFDVDQPIYWAWTSPPVTTFAVHDHGRGRTIMVLTYRDAASAQAARGHVQPLVLGYGRAVWRGNVALVQTSTRVLEYRFQLQTEVDNGLYVEPAVMHEWDTVSAGVDADIELAPDQSTANLSRMAVNVGGYSVEAADVRHELDWQLFENFKLPDGKRNYPGVVAHTSTTVERPKLVAYRIWWWSTPTPRRNLERLAAETEALTGWSGRRLGGQKDSQGDDLLWLANAVAGGAGSGWRTVGNSRPVAVQRGAHTARQNFVHVDPVGAQLLGQNSHQHPQCRFRARVRRHSRTAAMTLARPYHDEVAAAASLQVGDSEPGAVVGAVQINIEGGHPIGDATLLDVVPVQADAVIEHQDVEAAGAPHRCIQQSIHCRRVRHVGSDRERLAAVVHNRARDRLDFGTSPRHAHHGCACLRIAGGDRGADAAAGTRHDCHLAAQLISHDNRPSVGYPTDEVTRPRTERLDNCPIAFVQPSGGAQACAPSGSLRPPFRGDIQAAARFRAMNASSAVRRALRALMRSSSASS
jgi:hypothetical protein